MVILLGNSNSRTGINSITVRYNGEEVMLVPSEIFEVLKNEPKANFTEQPQIEQALKGNQG